jgi:hypothetical protein
MGPVLRCVVIASIAFASKASAQADVNLQNILVALTNAAEVTLLTPLQSGVTEVTSFRSPVRLSVADAAGAIERARRQLADLGVPRPTGLQLATALFGGPVDIPTGRTQLGGVVPGAGDARIRSQVIASGALPQAPSAAAGGTTMSAAEITYAMQLAVQQLAAYGITDPTPEQIRTAIVGGTLTPLGGPTITLPGVLHSRRFP